MTRPRHLGPSKRAAQIARDREQVPAFLRKLGQAADDLEAGTLDPAQAKAAFAKAWRRIFWSFAALLTVMLLATLWLVSHVTG